MTTPDSSAGPLVGGRYQVDHPIGAGNMGDVYRAVHHITRRPIALKMIKPHVAQAAGGVERFLREVRAAQAIAHPGVVEVLDAGVHGKTLYVAMELLEGRSLRERMEDEALPMGLDEGISILRAVLEPLAAAHEAGIVHRDLKPDNVYLHERPDGEIVVKLLDFGIAAVPEDSSATQTGFTMGTPYYMSPEQAIDPRRCTAASDVWSIGAMLFELLAGQVPFEGATAHAVCVQAIHEPHPALAQAAPDAPSALARLVDRCLSKAPEGRPADARALAQAMDAALVAPGPTAAEAYRQGRWRRPVLFGLAALLLAGVGAWWVLRPGASPGPAAPPDAATVQAVQTVDAAALPTQDAAPQDAAPDDAAVDAAPPDAAVDAAAEPPKPTQVVRRRARRRARPVERPARPAALTARAAAPADAGPPAVEDAAPPPPPPEDAAPPPPEDAAPPPPAVAAPPPSRPVQAVPAANRPASEAADPVRPPFSF